MKERLVQITELMKLLARAKGCACEPEITVVARHERISAIRVAHEDWCPHPHEDGSMLDAFAHELRRRNGRQ